MVCHLSEICHLWAWQWLCKHIILFLFPTIGFMIGYTRSLKGKPEHGKKCRWQDDKYNFFNDMYSCSHGCKVHASGCELTNPVGENQTRWGRRKRRLNREGWWVDGWGQGMIMGTGGGMRETKRVGFVNDVMPEHQRQNTEDESRRGGSKHSS